MSTVRSKVQRRIASKKKKLEPPKRNPTSTLGNLLIVHFVMLMTFGAFLHLFWNILCTWCTGKTILAHALTQSCHHWISKLSSTGGATLPSHRNLRPWAPHLLPGPAASLASKNGGTWCAKKNQKTQRRNTKIRHKLDPFLFAMFLFLVFHWFCLSHVSCMVSFAVLFASWFRCCFAYYRCLQV